LAVRTPAIESLISSNSATLSPSDIHKKKKKINPE
jgi:hypothetical protein